MLSWLIGVALFVLLWSSMWKRNLRLSFGVLLGLPIAWILSRFITPYVTGMGEIPLWLPPLPFAVVAVTLFVFSVLVWFKAGNLAPPKDTEESDQSH